MTQTRLKPGAPDAVAGKVDPIWSSYPSRPRRGLCGAVRGRGATYWVIPHLQ